MLARISGPMLVVVGLDDEFTLVSDAKFIAEHIPNSTLVVVEGAGHLPNLERDPEFNTALGRLPASGR